MHLWPVQALSAETKNGDLGYGLLHCEDYLKHTGKA